MTNAQPQPRVAILIFADAHQRDLRRRGLSCTAASLLSLPKLDGLGSSADVHWFCDHPVRAAAAPGIVLHRQVGRSFAQRLEHAVNTLAEEGYGKMVIVGRDCPQLDSTDVSRAIVLLDSHRLVIGPDHRGGCWLIGLHASEREKLRGIRWQHDTDAAELLSRFGESASASLEQKFDVDHAGDLRALAGIFAPAAAVLRLACPIDRPARVLPNQPLSFIRRAQQLPPPRLGLAA